MNLTYPINEHGVFVLDRAVINSIKSAARKSQLGRARICLHINNSSPVQEMIIALCKNSIVEPHRHPLHKSESYHLLEGEMNVNIFASTGEVIQVVKLHQNGTRMYRIQGNVWHQPVSISECAIYHEVYTGPFEKNEDVF